VRHLRVEHEDGEVEGLAGATAEPHEESRCVVHAHQRVPTRLVGGLPFLRGGVHLEPVTEHVQHDEGQGEGEVGLIEGAEEGEEGRGRTPISNHVEDGTKDCCLVKEPGEAAIELIAAEGEEVEGDEGGWGATVHEEADREGGEAEVA
jgi:hypothetical protein